MKEIDFIPEWHRADRIQKIRFIRRHTLLGVLFVTMMLWSFVVGHYVNRVSAQVEDVQMAMNNAKMRVDQSVQLENDIAVMKQKAAILDQIVPRTKVTAILAELSYLVQKNIILSKLSFTNEAIEGARQSSGAAHRAVVQVGQSETNQDVVILDTPLRVKVVLTGIAARPADAASLIARLEEAQYFEQVVLVFSRPQKASGQDVTEFEIQCYVADYQVQNKGS